jgi:hypothetical protein
LYIDFFRDGERYEDGGLVVPTAEDGVLINIWSDGWDGHPQVGNLVKFVKRWLGVNLRGWADMDGLTLENVEAVAELFVNRPEAKWITRR